MTNLTDEGCKLGAAGKLLSEVFKELLLSVAADVMLERLDKTSARKKKS